MNEKFEVSVFVDSLAHHLQQIYTGLYQLQRSGKIRLRLLSQSATGAISESKFNLWVVARSLEDNKTRRICFDMSDGRRILAPKQLEACDWYFKRSFHEAAYLPLAQELRSKIHPFGLNYLCTSENSLAYRIRLGIMSIMYTNAPDMTAYKNAVKLAFSTYRFFDKRCWLAQSEFEVDPHEPAHPKILFQSRVWEPKLHGADGPRVHELNECRAHITRALKTHFGTTFVGGLEPTNYATREYSDCLAPRSTNQLEYLKMGKECLIGISSIGLHNSTPWKMAEYLAASRCIVSERLIYDLPVPLQENVNYLPFSTPDECVKACETILSNPDLGQRMRRENWNYYQEHVRSDALLWRCLRTAFPQKSNVAVDTALGVREI